MCLDSLPFSLAEKETINPTTNAWQLNHCGILHCRLALSPVGMDSIVFVRRGCQYMGTLRLDVPGRHQHRERPPAERDPPEHSPQAVVGAARHDRGHLVVLRAGGARAHIGGHSPRLPATALPELGGLPGGRLRIRLLFPVLHLHHGIPGSGIGNNSLGCKHHPGNHHPPGRTLAGLLVRQTGSDLRRRSHYNGHHPAHHYPFFRQRVCRDFHLPWLYRGLFRPFLGNFLLQTIRPVHGSS